MHRALVAADRFLSLPRGWAILGLTIAAWVFVVVAVQIASALFAYISAIL